jgi:homocysteine S-methyltransferase
MTRVEKMHKKIEAQPKGFVTQVINSIDQVTRIVDKLKPQGFRIIPCVLISSEKNLKSAQMLKMNWSEYSKDLTGFVRQVDKIAGNVLVSSPNDFTGALELLQRLK